MEKYYYSKLSNSEKEICDKIIKSIRSLDEKIVFNRPIPNSYFSNIFDVIQKDYPDIFYLDIKNIRMVNVGFILTIELSYLYPKSTINKYKSQIDEVLNTFITSKVMAKSKIDRERYIYDALLRSVKYSNSISGNEDYSIIGPLFHHMGVCQGYSKTFQLLCEKAGLLCLSVFGISTLPSSSVNQGHVWNIVQISKNLRCQVDVTWDSCIYHAGASDYHQYFNISDQQMSIDHSWDRQIVPKTIM